MIKILLHFAENIHLRVGVHVLRARMLASVPNVRVDNRARAGHGECFIDQSLSRRALYA